MVTARTILSNTFVQVAGKVAIAFLGFVISKMLATYLRVEERGLYEFTYSFLGFVGIIADMGLYTIAIRELSKKKDEMEKIIGNILSIRNVLSVGCLILALVLVLVVPGLQKGMLFTVALIFAGMSMILALLNGTVTSVLQVHYKMKQATIAQVLGKIIIIGIMALSMFVLFQKASPGYDYTTSFWGFEMLFLAGVVGNLVMYLYTMHHAKKFVPLHYKFDFSFWKKLIRETFPYGLALILSTLYFKIDIIILNFMLPANQADFQIGIYSAAVKIVEIFAILPLFFLNTVLPLMSNYIAEKNEKIKKLMQYSFDFLYLMAAPIAVGGYITAYQIINVTNSAAYLSRLQDGFIGSDIALQIIIFTTLFSFLNLLFNFLLVAQNRQKKLIYINAVSLLFNIVTNIIFIPYYGIIACATTTVITEIIVLVLTFFYAKQGTAFSIGLLRFFKITLSALVMGAAVAFTQDYFIGVLGMAGFLVILGVAGLVYGAMLLVLRVVNKEMVDLMKKG